MIRLDKYLCDCLGISRKEAKELVKTGSVRIGGSVCKNEGFKLNEETDTVTVKGNECRYQRYRYYMLNKPAGVITATVDPVDKTVMELVDIVNKKDFFPVGRLDKDTVGLLIITNDGELAHKLLSPKYHVDKTYLVEAESELTDEDISKLENGVDIGDDKVTMPASVQRIESKKIRLTIREGRYHQVKRMLEAVGNKVICLKRLSFGAVWLDDKLEEGEFRELTSEETESLKGN